MTITQQPPTQAKGHEVWVGVDTHRDINVAVALDERGRRLGEFKVATTRHGSAELLAGARKIGDDLRGFAIEGTGTYGAGLTRYLQAEGLFVMEATRPRRDRMAQRNNGKSDSIDALRAAKGLLAEELSVTLKARDGDVEALRNRHVVKRSAIKARTAAINSMRSILISAPDQLRDQFRNAGKNDLVDRCARFRPGPDGGLEGSIKRNLRCLVRRCAPQLPQLKGVGTEVAATLLVAVGDNPTASAARPASPTWPAPRRSPPGAASPAAATDSTAAATAGPTAPSGRSS